VIGTAVEFSPIDPIKALYWSAVTNGVVSCPVTVTMMLMLMLMTMRADIMGGNTIGGRSSAWSLRRFDVLGWKALISL
jgi:hypothetical protein